MNEKLVISFDSLAWYFVLSLSFFRSQTCYSKKKYDMDNNKKGKDPHGKDSRGLKGCVKPSGQPSTSPLLEPSDSN